MTARRDDASSEKSSRCEERTLRAMTSSLDAMTELERKLEGRVIRPDHAEYDTTRVIFNATIDRRPALIVLPETTDEVATAVQIARTMALPITVRGGGHSVAGHAIADDAMTIDLRRMRGVTVDRVARRARVGGGALWEDVDKATTPHDLATTGGTFWDTGVGGLTLSGGLGYLMGTAGLTCDNLVRATVVTADGGIVEAGPDGDPELLWALRGGGGNFGVVTEFEFQLHPIGSWQAGWYTAPLDQAEDALLDLAAFVRQMPNEIVIFAEGPTTAEADVVAEVASSGEAAPEGLPAAARPDRLGCSLLFHGTPDAAMSAFAPLLSGGHWNGSTRSESYVGIQSDNTLPFGLRHYWKGHFLRDLDETAAAAIAIGMRTAPVGSSAFVLLEAINGQAQVEPPGGAAFGQREARWNASAMAIWEDDAHDAELIDWGRRTAASFAPSSYNGGGYANYAPVDETDERVRLAYGPERYARLQAIKRRYDPENVFRFNLNIPPAG
jgi:FAD/FMN-containing dehydrogenase